MKDKVEEIVINVDYEKTNDKFAPVIFACEIPITGTLFKMSIKWEVYRNCFDRIKTICFATTELPKGDKKRFSSFACLHPDHPEEFDLKIGMFKTFDRLLDVIRCDTYIFESMTLLSSEIKTWRNWRKLMWASFHHELENNWGSNCFSWNNSVIFYNVLSQVDGVVVDRG